MLCHLKACKNVVRLDYRIVSGTVTVFTKVDYDEQCNFIGSKGRTRKDSITTSEHIHFLNEYDTCHYIFNE